MVEDTAWNVGSLLFLPLDLPAPVLEHTVVVPLAREISKYSVNIAFSVCGLISGTGSLLCCDLGQETDLCALMF